MCLDCKVWEYKRGFETNRWEKTSCWDCGSGVSYMGDENEESKVKERSLEKEEQMRIAREEERQRRKRGEVYEFGVRDDVTDETLGGMLGTVERANRSATL